MHVLLVALRMRERVIVVGGGCIGLLAAGRFSEFFDVTLLDHVSLSEKVESMQNQASKLFAITSTSFDSIMKLGIDIEDGGQTINGILAYEGNKFMILDSDKLLGKPFGVMIEERHLYKWLYDSVCERGVKIVDKTEVLEYKETSSGAQLTLSDGATLEAELVLGADGKNSAIRDFIGIDKHVYEYGQDGIICDIEHTKEHHGIAIEAFFPVGPLAFLPKRDPHRSSIVWSIDRKYANIADHFEDILREYSDGILGEIDITSDVRAFPLSLTYVNRLYNYNAVLIGDACHFIHPVTGQGFNLGVRDVEQLLEACIEAKELGLELPAMLEKYSINREFDINCLMEGTHMINLIFSNDVLMLKLGRKMTIDMINSSDTLKRFVVKYGMAV